MASVAVSELKATYKPRDAWWTVLLVDPLAVHLLRSVVHLRWVTPNGVTIVAFAVGVASGACFAAARTPWLVAGAVLYHLAFVLDCVDGKLARWRGACSAFGAWLDMVMDRLRVLACTVGLMGGQYAMTGRPVYLFIGVGIVFLDVFRQWNGLLVFTMRADMRGELEAATGQPTAAPVDLQRGFRDRHRGAARARAWLIGHRIRPHLVSGVEFQMAVFIIAPLTGLMISMPLVVGGLFVLFEVAVMYKFWLSTHDYEHALTRIREDAEQDVPNQRATAGAAPAR